MTPAERARLIDKQEFAAECAAVRHRAFAYVERRRQDTRKEIANWLSREPVKLTFKPRVPKVKPAPAPKPAVPSVPLANPDKEPKRLTVDGLSLTRREWAYHLGITYNALNTRISRLGSLEAAVRHKSARRSGVTVAGMTMSITEWADYLSVARTTLYHRIKSEPAETVIANLLADPPGVVLDFEDYEGTGAGGTAQETPNITFSGSEACPQ
ncbi:hypothetical protein SM11_chr2321 [Sinorhizobium meliloti SM11]|uniref:Uncharacterized protein n=1 Tax=Sinorhizobium meliloti (strain SM11) TaxID=707241 RepID=F7X317_SINMM|nr:hypothetical protein [Sinorhizobium meliloti]AEH79575.1 hypothetical protein SM11_chr2321 [Sinorhizobium meliloti SM11]MDE4557573.1 hypothetical protein [Sinorhizobium meliloti SM11]